MKSAVLPTHKCGRASAKAALCFACYDGCQRTKKHKGCPTKATSRDSSRHWQPCHCQPIGRGAEACWRCREEAEDEVHDSRTATFRLNEGVSHSSRAEDLDDLHRLQKSSTKPREGVWPRRERGAAAPPSWVGSPVSGKTSSSKPLVVLCTADGGSKALCTVVGCVRLVAGVLFSRYVIPVHDVSRPVLPLGLGRGGCAL